MVSLILLTYNDYNTTASFLDELDMDAVDKVIVVDNNSPDGSYEKLQKYAGTQIDIINSGRNKGYAAGNNFGAFYALQKYNPDYLLISNPDVCFDKKTVAKMIDFMEKNPNAGAITCKMKCTSGINLPIASKQPRYIDCILENLIILKKIVGNKTFFFDNFFEKPVVKVDVLPGSFFMIRAGLFQKINGFDENTFLYYEENILANKLTQIGYDRFLITDCEYVHKHSVSINKNITSVKNRLNIAFESRRYYCQKYLACGGIKIFLLMLTYKIGLFNYLFALRITRKNR